MLDSGLKSLLIAHSCTRATKRKTELQSGVLGHRTLRHNLVLRRLRIRNKRILKRTNRLQDVILIK